MELPLLRVAVLSRAEAQALRLSAQVASATVEAAAFALDAPEPSLAQVSPGLLVVSLDGVDVRSAIRLASARAPGCPLLLVGELPWPSGWLQAFAVGVVGVVLPEALDAAVVTFLHASLPGRPGAIRGSGSFGELPAFLDCLEALGRTGTLVVTSVTEGVGRVESLGGEVVEARFGLRSGPDALTALRTSRGSWSFREHAGRTAPAPCPLPELDPRSVRLLLVHEDSATLAARADHLARQGFQVVSAHGPAEALQALAVGPFEAAVLDVAEAAEVRRRLASDLRSRETHQVVAARTGEPSRGGLPAGASPAQVEAAVRAGLAPRAEAQAQLRGWQLDESVAFEVDAVGLQWLVRQLEAVGVTGTLELRGAGEVAQVWFIDGRLCQATRGGAWGAEALAPLLFARGVTALLEVAGLPEGEGFAGAPTGAVLEALVARAEDLVRGPGTAATVHASGVYRAA